jgi:hypothetical protein
MDAPVITRVKWLLIRIGVTVVLAFPRTAAMADFGSWQFEVTATGNPDFHKVYDFRSRRPCEDEREATDRGIARVLAQHSSTIAGRVARRLHVGPCGAVRHGR